MCVAGGGGADHLFTHRPPGQGEAHPSLIYRTVGHLSSRDFPAGLTEEEMSISCLWEGE